MSLCPRAAAGTGMASAQTRHMPQPPSIVQMRSWDREQDVPQHQLRAIGTGSSTTSLYSRRSPVSPSLFGAAHDGGLGGL